MKRLLLSIWLLAALPAGASVKAWLDNREIAAGESVRLTLEHDGQASGQPDLSPLEKDFDILGTSSSSNIHIINGRMSAGTEVQLTLSPKHTGQITIPALTWAGEHSTPLTLTVGTGGQSGKAGGSRVFIETEVDPKQPYVLSAVHLTVRVYEAAPLYRESLELESSDAALVRQQGQDSAERVVKNGVTYVVKTRHYLLFPQRSGTLQLPGATLNAYVEGSSPRSDPFDPFAAFTGMVRNLRPILLHSDPITLNVQPRPASATGPYWLPAQQVSLEARWQPQTFQAHVGEPLTVDLTLKALGLTAAQLPDLSRLLALPQGLKTYPEQAKLKDTDRGDTVEGSREQTIAIIADQPGHYSIPALQVSWWDTKSHEGHQVSVPAHTLEILPAAGTAAASPPVTPQVPAVTSVDTRSSSAPAAPAPATKVSPSTGIWPVLSGLLLVLWLATAGAWVWSRRGSKTPAPPAADEPVSLARERAAFQQACRENDAPGARRHLLAWAAQHYRGNAPSGLGALARQLEDPELGTLLEELDRACFARPDSPWQGEALARALTRLPAVRGTAGARAGGLAPLYP